MKLILKKDWVYNHPGGKGTLNKGYVIYDNKRAKKLPSPQNGNRDGICDEGWVLQDWYGYGQNEVIPKKYLKVIQ